MAILLTSLLFVFEILVLPKYRVNYYDYTIKWCFGIQSNWCVSLDIAHILALSLSETIGVVADGQSGLPPIREDAV